MALLEFYMDKDLILQVKKKREFSGLPENLVWKFLKKNNLDIKETRANLRKFYGVFLTNKVLKGKTKEVLNSHISSKGRDYPNFYKEIFEGISNNFSVIDLGCGVNGFSLQELQESLGVLNYCGVEASKQIVDITNNFFTRSSFNAKVIWGDLFNIGEISRLIKNIKSPKVILMLQVIDALESLEKDYSKKLLLEIEKSLGGKDFVVISMPLKSISGRKNFEVGRQWLKKFLDETFNIEKDFVVGNERIFVVRKN
jgi:hypothetical protein